MAGYDRPMAEPWNPEAPGVLRLPSGRLVRGRGLRRARPDGPDPTFGVYLLGKPPPAVPWESRWIRWPDFRLPADEAGLRRTLAEAWQRAGGERAERTEQVEQVEQVERTERVEIACGGGRGRTGTALACLAILDGVPAAEAVAFVREHYSARAVETPGQRRFVARWPGPDQVG
jgi:hypothetical protein